MLRARNAPGVEQLTQVHAVHELHEEEVKRLSRVEGRRSRARRRVEGRGWRAATGELVRGDARPTSLPKLVQRHDARMIQLGERLGFARETFGECGISANSRRQDFQRDNAIQLLLACFVNRTHAAFADEFEQFQLRKQRRQFGNGWWRERRLFAFGNGVRGRAHFEQAGGAKSGERTGRKRRAALRASGLGRMVRDHFRSTHTQTSAAKHARRYRLYCHGRGKERRQSKSPPNGGRLTLEFWL
jgi:hypothetical protein